MKTAISVPDDLFAEADRLAQRLNRSRSRIYSDAVREYVAKHDPDAVTAALDRVYGGSDHGPDPLMRAAAQRILQQSDW